MDLFSKQKYMSDHLQLTQLLLDAINLPITEKAIEKHIEQLRMVINYHDKKYYVDATQQISDFDYDQLFKWLKNLEEQYPQYITPDSPTQMETHSLTILSWSMGIGWRMLI